MIFAYDLDILIMINLWHVHVWYIFSHTNLRTSFIHPVTGESALPVHDDNSNM